MAQINTIFRWCNDVDTVRHFYTDCLELDETFYRNDDEHGWLTYQLGETQLVFTQTTESLDEPSAFAMNPAYEGGSTCDPSWVMKVDVAAFTDIVARIKQTSYPTYGDNPYSNRPGHLQFIVRDPLGLTLELYAVDETAVVTEG